MAYMAGSPYLGLKNQLAIISRVGTPLNSTSQYKAEVAQLNFPPCPKFLRYWVIPIEWFYQVKRLLWPNNMIIALYIQLNLFLSIPVESQFS